MFMPVTESGQADRWMDRYIQLNERDLKRECCPFRTIINMNVL
jgi:hypothetical protein